MCVFCYFGSSLVMVEEFINSKSLSFLDSEALPRLRRGFNWWEQSGGIIGRDNETNTILDNMQISIIEDETRIPPLVHAGMTSVTAMVFGRNWALDCKGATLPDENFDQTVTEQYRKVLENKIPLVHHVVAPLEHPKKGACIVSYERLLLPCRYKGGGDVIGSVTGMRSFALTPF